MVVSMALPPQIKDQAENAVAGYCTDKVPSDLADEIRIEYKIRGRAISIYELRPPWSETLGPTWTSMCVATFEWDPDTRCWTLFARDRNDRRLPYDFVAPTPDLKPLLDEVDQDPTGIFWG